ncbi:daptide biosynthesis RiPP recognition protein [Micromonospora sp. SL4-19]|uniref:daptide biosynthesis RiPP recognition protein n=1 Tax=Micromonospora sp. SL4-19 TaxID=3399129 RepID=UPI003A4E5E2C
MDRAELRRVKQNIMSWGTGNQPPSSWPAEAAATISLADRTHLADVIGTGLAGDGTIILATGDHDASRGVVGIDGSLAEPGTELSVDSDFFLQTQDYASSRFMSILGPTLIRIGDLDDDFEAFLADVDQAVSEGVFPEFAIAPAVRIADVPALGAASPLDGPGLRLHVDRDGAISTAPGGSALGHLGTGLADLVAAWEKANAASELPCAVCLGAVLPEAERTARLGERPSVARYFTALDALRTLTVNDIAGLRVSGFGGRITAGLADDDPAEDVVDPTLPLLMWTADRGYVYEPDRRRVFTVDHTAAQAVECLLATGSPELAARHLPGSTVTQVNEFFTGAGVALTPAQPKVGAR